MGKQWSHLKKYNNILERYLFPLFLLIYPLLWMNQGIDVSDPMYSLTNFRFFPQMEGSWALATYLANVAGWLLMKLPFGGTLPVSYTHLTLPTIYSV